MLEYFTAFFEPNTTSPATRFGWPDDMFWLHVLSNVLLAIACLAIPVAFARLARGRNDSTFSSLMSLFGITVLLFGLSYASDIWVVWTGAYRIAGLLDAVTAFLCLTVAVILHALVPTLVCIPSPYELKHINDSLQSEIDEREEAELELIRHRGHLEELIRERTQELESVNLLLRKEIRTREQAEASVRHSETRYQSLYEKYLDLYENAPDMYVSVDALSGMIVQCNVTLSDQTGYPKHVLIGMPFFSLSTPAFRRRTYEALDRIHTDGEVYNVELQLRRKSGQPIDVTLNASAIRNENGVLIASRCSFRDITVQKRAQLAHEESNARIKAIVDHAVDAIITIDERGIIESFNPAAEAIFGYAHHEVYGKNVNCLMPMDYAAEHDAYLERYLISGERRIIGVGREVEGMRHDGTRFPIELSVSEVLVAGKRIFTGIVRDITERKQLEHIKDDFVSIVSHELRTPLTSINGSLGVLASGTVGAIPEAAQRMIGIARRNCERLVRLINDLLDLQKMEAGKFDIHREPVNLVQLMNQSLESNAGFARAHNVRLELVSTTEPCPLDGDPDRLLQVMANLISNAAKFSPTDETITIRVDREPEMVRVAIEDRGIGIPEEQIATIFDKFVQVDSTLQRQKGGTGLGLSISKRIIEMHGGRLSVESTMGKGTTFFFELPLAPVEEGTLTS
ncbi:MAG: PAS domain S-box protein [Rhodothermales bacterium]